MELQKLKRFQKASLEFIKRMSFLYTSSGNPRYEYNVEPIQLATLINEIERLKEQCGNIVEIGVARGMTTRFLAEHLIKEGLHESLQLYALDTFSSFTSIDLRYEIENRNKLMSDLRGFEYNDFGRWKSNFAAYSFVTAIQTDCSEYNYSAIAPIKITFLDVDLYLPTIKTLPKVYDATVSGGVILVDDVLEDTQYDGAYEAYMQFCEERKICPKIIGNKCGIIYKP